MVAAVAASGVYALLGALIGGGFTMGAQMWGDRRARVRAEWAEHRQYVAALRLNLLDLRRSEGRLRRMRDECDGRGFTELPRGAWTEYRSILARRLADTTFERLEDVYRSVIEWNEIVWSGWAKTAPEPFHGSDQRPPGEEHAARLLDGMHSSISQCVSGARNDVEALVLLEANRPESDFTRMWRARRN
jgi:hypothetical protein